MSETNSNICIINLQNGIGTSSPQISRFTHNFDSIKFITDNDFSDYAVMIITAIDGKVGIVTEGEMLEKTYDRKSGETTILWFPQREVTANDGVVVYQIAAYDTGSGKSVWYSKEGRLIVTDSIDTTDLSTEIISSSPNLITQLLTQLKKIELNTENSAENIQTNQTNIACNANSIASLNDEFNLYKQEIHNGEEVYNANSSLSQSGKAVAQAVASIVNSAPETLNTLEELATALGNDPNFATTIMTLLGGKVDTGIFNRITEELQEDSVIHKSNQLNPHGVTKEQVGLSAVDNTSDKDKPISDAVEKELKNKVDKVGGYGIVAVEPFFDPEEEEYTNDKVQLYNKVYDDSENQIIDREASVYSVEGADKKFKSKVDKEEGKGLSTIDFDQQWAEMVDSAYWGVEDLMRPPYTEIPSTLYPNYQYNFGEAYELSLTFPTVANDGDVIYLTFKSGATPTALTIDTTNTSDIEVIPESNTGYEIFGKYNGEVWIVNYSEYTVSEV